MHWKHKVCSHKSNNKAVVVQVVHNFVGYASVWWTQGLYIALVVLSLGLIWVLGLYSVHARLWMLRKCSLSKADVVCAQARLISTLTADQHLPFNQYVLCAVH